MPTIISQDYLKEILEYDPETGFFHWKIRLDRSNRWNATYANKKAGYESSGYAKIGINHEQYYCHQLAWLYFYGEWPDKIDHKDGVRSNNKISNLRLATQSENTCNKPKQKNNTSGYKGVFFNNREKKWQARLNKHGKQYHLGTFTNPEDAHAAYCAAANKYHGEFARTA